MLSAPNPRPPHTHTHTMPPARCSWADPGARATASPHDPAGRVGPRPGDPATPAPHPGHLGGRSPLPRPPSEPGTNCGVSYTTERKEAKMPPALPSARADVLTSLPHPVSGLSAERFSAEAGRRPLMASPGPAASPGSARRPQAVLGHPGPLPRGPALPDMPDVCPGSPRARLRTLRA